MCDLGSVRWASSIGVRLGLDMQSPGPSPDLLSPIMHVSKIEVQLKSCHYVYSLSDLGRARPVACPIDPRTCIGSGLPFLRCPLQRWSGSSPAFLPGSVGSELQCSFCVFPYSPAPAGDTEKEGRNLAFPLAPCEKVSLFQVKRRMDIHFAKTET